MSRLIDRRNAKRVNGLRRDPRTGAGKLAKSERGYGGVLAFDFTDNSAAVYDPTTQANIAYSQGVTDGNGNFRGVSSLLTYTSPSNKLTLQSDGFLKYQAHNLILQSEDLTNAAWTKLNVAASSATLLTASAGAGIHRVNNASAATVVVGQRYTGVVRLKAGTNQYGYASLFTGGSLAYSAVVDLSGGTITDTSSTGSPNGASSISSVGDGFYDVSVSIDIATGTTLYLAAGFSDSATPTYSASQPTFTAAGTETLTCTRMHVYRYPANSDYIKTTSAAKYALPLEYDTSGNCLGLLVEEARTNLCLQSTDFSTTWAATNCSVTTNATVAPDGTTTADKLHPSSTASAEHNVNQSMSMSAATTYIYSCCFKAENLTGAIFRVNHSGSFVNVIFDVTDGSVTYNTPGLTTYSESIGNGWYRLGVQFTYTGGALQCVVGPHPGNVNSATWTPANTDDGVYMWGAQFEAGSFPTSPIITYGATATRAADQKSQLTSTFPLSATAGSLYAYVVPYAGSDLAGIVSLNDGTGNEEIVIYKDASANIVAQVEDGGVGQLAPLDSTANASSGTAFKVALAWAADDFALSADGTAAQTDTGGTLPTVTTLEIGVDQANNYFNGHIKAISYVPRRKTNAELQAETT